MHIESNQRKRHFIYKEKQNNGRLSIRNHGRLNNIFSSIEKKGIVNSEPVLSNNILQE